MQAPSAPAIELELVDDRDAETTEVIYVCAACDGIAGYYPRRYEVVACPHCDADAYWSEFTTFL